MLKNRGNEDMKERKESVNAIDPRDLVAPIMKVRQLAFRNHDEFIPWSFGFGLGGGHTSPLFDFDSMLLILLSADDEEELSCTFRILSSLLVASDCHTPPSTSSGTDSAGSLLFDGVSPLSSEPSWISPCSILSWSLQATAAAA